MSTAVATVRANPDRYKKDFDAVVAYLSQYIDKKAPTLFVNVALVTQIRPAKRQKTSESHGTCNGKINTHEKSITLCQWHSANSCMSYRKKPGS